MRNEKERNNLCRNLPEKGNKRQCDKKISENMKEEDIRDMKNILGNVLWSVTICIFFLIVIMPIGTASSQCLTIDEKYAQLEHSVIQLGAPISQEITAADGIGHFRNYEGGSIYWTESTCAYEIHGPILDKYLSADYPFWYKMGYPTSDVKWAYSGNDIVFYSNFTGGAIFWRTFCCNQNLNYSAHALRGDILKRWEDLGGLNSYLGYPMTDLMPSDGEAPPTMPSDNNMNYTVAYFAHGIIYLKDRGGIPSETRDSKESGSWTKDFDEIDASPVVTHWQIHRQSETTDVYRIDVPYVGQEIYEYPEVKFQSGDRVRVEAGGCVQHGGHGTTWKRYVDPLEEGGVPDSTHYGTIFIPGAYDNKKKIGTMRFVDLLSYESGGVLYVPTPTILWLGYLDGDYSDGNGYSDRDDDNGVEDQCKGIGPAWVVLTVEHNVTPPKIEYKPLDLAWEKLDDNFLPLNPKWGLEVEKNIHPDVEKECGKYLRDDESNWKGCTNQKPKFDIPTDWSFLGIPILDNSDLCEAWAPDNLPYGHVNWEGGGTYIGLYRPYNPYQPLDDHPPALVWDSRDIWDDDYNFNLWSKVGLTTQNPGFNVDKDVGAVGIEFDSDETIDNFDTPWWNTFRDAIVNQKKAMTNGRYTIITGLLGLDCQHGCKTEIAHPTWAMAIRVKNINEDPSKVFGVKVDSNYDEVWAIFVRNWGNEGYCSSGRSHNLNLPSNQYTFRLPWGGAGSSKVDMTESTVFKSNDPDNVKMEFGYAPKEGTLVTFTLPEPKEDGAWISGELHLQYSSPNSVASLKSESVSNEQLQEEEVAPQEENIEYILDVLYEQMTEQQRKTFIANYPEKSITHGKVIPLPKVERFAHLQTLLPGQTYKMPTTSSGPASTKRLERDKKIMGALVAAFGSEDALRRSFLSISGKAIVNRDIENQILTAGSSTKVTLSIKSNVSQSLSLNETLPSGWTLEEISNGNAEAFDPIKNEWKWSKIGKDETRTVTYKLNIPSDAEARTYYINGSFVDNSGFYRDITGENTITIVAKVHGTKWEDINGNGNKDAGDQGLAEWNITINGTDIFTGNEVNIPTTTDTNGNYSVNLTAGTYTISEKLKDGWIQTAPSTGSYTITITTGINIYGKDFGNFKLGEIHGMKWEDLNANNKKDSFEKGLSDWNINLKGKDTITGKEVNLTTITDTDSNYSFMNLTNGTYIVSEELKNGWVQTTPNVGKYTIAIRSGSNIIGQDFGNFKKGKITGGGNISVPGDSNVTFGIIGQYPDNSSTAQGNVEYQDHSAKLNIKSIQINTVATTVDKKIGVITGLARVNGKGSYPFEVYVEDNGEPGKGADIFRIFLPTYPYSNGNILNGGNIQIRE